MIHAYDENCLAYACKSIARLFDVAINDCCIPLTKFWDKFSNSKTAYLIENGDYSTIVGKSGIELYFDIYDTNIIKYRNVDDRSQEYWLGWILTKFQWETSMRFKDISKYFSIEDLYHMYYPYHEMDSKAFINTLIKQINNTKEMTNIKQIRINSNLSQKELSIMSNVPIRTLQQYEQNQKDINKAQAIYILSLSKALKCSPYDLLELKEI